MTWLIAGPLIAAVVLTLAWLSRGPYRPTLISELPGLLFILAAGKPYRAQARQIMASRARRDGQGHDREAARDAALRSEITLHAYQDAMRRSQ